MKSLRRLTAAVLTIFIMCCCLMSVCAMAAEQDDSERGTAEGYTLTEVEDVVVIDEEETPMANLQIADENCCILHFCLLVGALLVAVYYTHSERMSQLREFEIRRELGR